MLFSERMGIKPIATQIQIDTMDKPLRNGLWNVLHIFIWERALAWYNQGHVYESFRPSHILITSAAVSKAMEDQQPGIAIT